MPRCIFCKIVDREVPASIIFEDDEVIAFDDSNPKAPVHVLIIPKVHIETVNNIQAIHHELVGKMFSVASLIAKQLNIAEDGYRLLMNCNKHGGQEVYHIHLHLLGGKQLAWNPAGLKEPG